jgi:hypothetical protein
MSDLNIAGIPLSPRPKSVWRILINLSGKIILMNVASSIVFHEWTVKRLLKNYRLVFSCDELFVIFCVFKLFFLYLPLFIILCFVSLSLHDMQSDKP